LKDFFEDFPEGLFGAFSWRLLERYETPTTCL
jgi:hypothetical protein